jgi:hypothetical protein
MIIYRHDQNIIKSISKKKTQNLISTSKNLLLLSVLWNIKYSYLILLIFKNAKVLQRIFL